MLAYGNTLLLKVRVEGHLSLLAPLGSTRGFFSPINNGLTHLHGSHIFDGQTWAPCARSRSGGAHPPGIGIKHTNNVSTGFGPDLVQRSRLAPGCPHPPLLKSTRRLGYGFSQVLVKFVGCGSATIVVNDPNFVSDCWGNRGCSRASTSFAINGLFVF